MEKLSNYMVKILDQVNAANFKAGGVSSIHVQHDDWCNMLNGKPNCNCNPDITISEING